MRNVNLHGGMSIGVIERGFILTMRNVNGDNFFIDEFKSLGFILTMRNVNLVGVAEEKLFLLVLY